MKSYLPLVAGTIGLLWALFALDGVFVREHQDATRALLDEEKSLSSYSRALLEDALRQELLRHAPAFQVAADHPLEESPGALWIGERQVRPLWSRESVDEIPTLPRTEARKDGFYLKELTFALWTGKETGLGVVDAEVRERISAVNAMARAADEGDRKALETATARWGLHRERFVLAPSWEASTGVAALAILVSQTTAQPLDGRFMEAAFFGEKNVARPGVVAHLLDPELRARIPRRDLEGLLSLSRSLAKDARVLPPRFDEVAREMLSNAPAPPPVEHGLWLREGELALRDNVGTRVIKLDIDALVRELKLPREGLSPRLVLSDAFSDEWTLSLSDAPFARAQQEFDARLRLKRGLLAGVVALWALVVALSFLLVRRRQRFVELKDGFVSAVSHELRTPLASIRVQAETLERKLRDDPRARDYPTRIVKDIDGLSFLVENLLSFSRLERGRITPSLSRVRVDELIAQSRDHLARMFEGPIEWTVTGVDEVLLEVDPDLVRLCLDNLAKNGAQYNERRPILLEAKGRKSADGFALRFRDNGVGIDPGDQDRIFEDFFRGRTERAVRGSGLGLAICDAVMRAHGGSIRLVESSAEGTTFELTFGAGCLVESKK